MAEHRSRLELGQCERENLAAVPALSKVGEDRRALAIGQSPLGESSKQVGVGMISEWLRALAFQLAAYDSWKLSHGSI